jgi:hypothetical protein
MDVTRQLAPGEATFTQGLARFGWPGQRNAKVVDFFVLKMSFSGPPRGGAPIVE